MAKIEFDEKLVEQGVLQITDSEKLIEDTPNKLVSAIGLITNAKGGQYLDVSKLQQATKFTDDVHESVNVVLKRIEEGAQTILEYNKDVDSMGFLERVFGTSALAVTKVVEGFGSGVEQIVDGFASIAGWVIGIFNPEAKEAIGEFVKKDYVGDWFQDRYKNELSGIVKASYMKEDGFLANNVFKIVGTAVAYGVAQAAVGGVVGMASGSTYAAGAAAARSSLAWGMGTAFIGSHGAGVQAGLKSGQTYNEAMWTGVKAGTLAAVITYGVSRIFRAIGNRRVAAADSLDDMADDITDDLLSGEGGPTGQNLLTDGSSGGNGGNGGSLPPGGGSGGTGSSGGSGTSGISGTNPPDIPPGPPGGNGGSLPPGGGSGGTGVSAGSGTAPGATPPDIPPGGGEGIKLLGEGGGTQVAGTPGGDVKIETLVIDGKPVGSSEPFEIIVEGMPSGSSSGSRIIQTGFEEGGANSLGGMSSVAGKPKAGVGVKVKEAPFQSIKVEVAPETQALATINTAPSLTQQASTEALATINGSIAPVTDLGSVVGTKELVAPIVQTAVATDVAPIVQTAVAADIAVPVATALSKTKVIPLPAVAALPAVKPQLQTPKVVDLSEIESSVQPRELTTQKLEEQTEPLPVKVKPSTQNQTTTLEEPQKNVPETETATKDVPVIPPIKTTTTTTIPPEPPTPPPVSEPPSEQPKQVVQPIPVVTEPSDPVQSLYAPPVYEPTFTPFVTEPSDPVQTLYAPPPSVDPTYTPVVTEPSDPVQLLYAPPPASNPTTTPQPSTPPEPTHPTTTPQPSLPPDPTYPTTTPQPSTTPEPTYTPTPTPSNPYTPVVPVGGVEIPNTGIGKKMELKDFLLPASIGAATGVAGVAAAIRRNKDDKKKEKSTPKPTKINIDDLEDTEEKFEDDFFEKEDI